MRPRLLAATLLIGLATAPAVTARAGETAAPAPAPYESIRSLRRLQEGIAHGDAAAQASLPTLLTEIGTRFVDADPSAWRETRNAHAAILYLFSGGRPAVIRTVLGRSAMPRELDRVLKGALAYGEGQDQIARDLLAPIDPKSLAATVGSQLSLVEGTLWLATDKAKAGHYFDLARLLAPGSLVEEAALRRQAVLEADQPDLARFVALSRQYLHRFGSSVYAPHFRQRFAGIAMRVATAGDPAAVALLEPALAELAPAQAAALYLAMARLAIVRGHADAARLAAGKVATLGSEGAGYAARAKLYLDAASIVSEDVAKGVAALESVDASGLSAEDADLRTAALAVAHAVQVPVPESATPAVAADGIDQGLAATMEEARRALARGDGLVKANP